MNHSLLYYSILHYDSATQQQEPTNQQEHPNFNEPKVTVTMQAAAQRSRNNQKKTLIHV